MHLKCLKTNFGNIIVNNYLLYFIYLQRISIFDNAIALDLRFFWMVVSVKFQSKNYHMLLYTFIIYTFFTYNYFHICLTIPSVIFYSEKSELESTGRKTPKIDGILHPPHPGDTMYCSTPTRRPPHTITAGGSPEAMKVRLAAMVLQPPTRV